MNRYAQILEHIFVARFDPANPEKVAFLRDDVGKSARKLRIPVPKNIGDLIYSFRYRTPLPESVRRKAPQGKVWIIWPQGPARYAFLAVAKELANIQPDEKLSETKVPNATPGIIARYALTDEQALLAILRYNRLIDVFTGVACYSLQNHLRTTVPGMGQVETDEIYIGVDRRGVHYAIPVQAKGGKDRLSIVQIGQDIALCASKFPGLVCRPVAAQFMKGDMIALFEFEPGEKIAAVTGERHYRLTPPDAISAEDLEAYRSRLA